MFALNLGRRLVALNYAQASLRPSVHRLLTRTPVKPACSPRRSAITSTYLPHPASNLQLRSSSKHPREIPKDYGKRKPALSNASAVAKSSNENINKKGIDEADLASQGLKPGGFALNHLLQPRKDESVGWGEDVIGYQIEHQRLSFVFVDVGEKEQSAKAKIQGSGNGNPAQYEW